MVVEPASVRASVRSHFQRSSSLKPLGQFYLEHPWIGGMKVYVFYLDRIRTLVAMAT